MEKYWLDTPYDLNGKSVWVTGHQGMVGSALMQRLRAENCRLLTVDRDALDLRRQADVEGWMSENKPEIVVIAAATVGGILANSENPAPFFYDNISISTNIIHSAYQCGVERLLFLGSSCIYPRNCPQPMKEDALLTGALEETNEAYALAKIGGLKMVEYYRKQYGCSFISAMPCNLYGPGDRYDAYLSHVIPALIMKIHNAKKEGAGSVRVWGTGTPLREFLYIDDLADALVFLLKNYNGTTHINVGSGQETSILELVKIISEVIDYKGEIQFDDSMPDGVPRKVLDSNILLNVGWKPKMCPKEGINAAYRSFLTQK